MVKYEPAVPRFLLEVHVPRVPDQLVHAHTTSTPTMGRVELHDMRVAIRASDRTVAQSCGLTQALLDARRRNLW
jgi:hypothetical protein